MFQLDELLGLSISEGASDLHLVAGEPPRMRVNGRLVVLVNDLLENPSLRDGLFAIMSDRARSQLNETDNADFAYQNDQGARFRVNVFRHLRGMGGAFRVVPSKVPTIEALGLPATIKKLCRLRQGLILVTGKTGSGKTTTLAAMIDRINRELQGHIVTIEDPIEYLYPRAKALISQREVGSHTQGFRDALRSALREDPDVILIGELRDRETMQLAVTAAETGHLVLGTLHTNGAAASVERAINLFPADKHSHIRNLLSTSLRGVISQQLLPRMDGEGRLVAVELLVNTPAVSNLIREGRNDQLEASMQSGGASGMTGMDAAIYGMLDRSEISQEIAYEAVRNKAEFIRKFGEPNVL